MFKRMRINQLLSQGLPAQLDTGWDNQLKFFD